MHLNFSYFSKLKLHNDQNEQGCKNTELAILSSVTELKQTALTIRLLKPFSVLNKEKHIRRQSNFTSGKEIMNELQKLN